MNIQCKNCQRHYELDDSKLADIPALQCTCGARIDVKPPVAEHIGAGQRVGNYELIHRIAVGGMGEIFYGKIAGIEGFEKEVAIKKMLPHLSADRSFIDMMVKEAKLTVLLNHPNIVQVYDLAKQGEEYYIAMEYVPGITIGTILESAFKEKKKLPPEVVVHIVSHTLRGLSYAHNLTTSSGEPIGILHRDITPQNILVTRRGYVKIADFGIAKAVNEISTTSPGMIKGKLGYIAPEQLEGREPDQRVDLFCAGILLWEMLTVRRLFKGSSEVDTFRLISEAQVPALSGFRTDVKPELEAVIRRSLDKNPDARYLRAEAFISALAQAMAPQTPDDMAEITAKYFAENPQYFSGLFVPSQATAAPADESTRTIKASKAQAPASSLQSADKFTRSIPVRKRPWPMLGAGAVLALIVASAAVWTHRGPDMPAMSQTRTQQPQVMDALPPPAAAQPQAPAVVPTAPVAGAPAATPQAAKPSATGPNTMAIAPPAPVPNPTPAPAEAAPAAAVDPQAAEKKAQSRAAARAARLEAEHARKPLTGAEIQATVQRYQAEVIHCLRDVTAKDAPAKLEAHITIETTGRVSQVEFTPPLTGTSDKCLSHSLMAMRFRRHPVDGLKVTIPLKIQVL